MMSRRLWEVLHTFGTRRHSDAVTTLCVCAMCCVCMLALGNASVVLADHGIVLH